LVRLALRARFRYSSDGNFSKGKWRPFRDGRLTRKSMILEDLEHRYEGLKQRITLVRSYL